LTFKILIYVNKIWQNIKFLLLKNISISKMSVNLVDKFVNRKSADILTISNEICVIN